MNNETNKKDQDSKKIVTLIILISVFMLCTTSATYAYFAIGATNDNVITGTAATASLTLTVTEATLGGTSSGPKTNVMVPQKEAALSTAMGSNYKCVDANGNTVCKVYTIVVTNKSTATVKLKGTITFSGVSTMPNLKWRKTTDTTTLGTGTTTAANNTNAQTLDTEKSLAKDASATYYIVIWINAQLEGANEVAQTDSGTWTATISFTSSNGTGVTSTITS